ncbi:hypothetical protein EVAR_42853_1 [Eumeta japonica]|uniref:DUF4794 domain-containing protein n=1 Tax=Eumeta variegata TaxID=151549 RepID=A0A4C1WI18_EUMVA|nr:hypothetical protein EVAR_42853_1 [Eumeta japonica]
MDHPRLKRPMSTCENRTALPPPTETHPVGDAYFLSPLTFSHAPSHCRQRVYKQRVTNRRHHSSLTSFSNLHKMNALFCLLLVAFATTTAEPPRFRSPRFQFQRQELAPSGEGEAEETTPRQEEAPYVAAGFRPAKEFKLPVRQELAPPTTTYGAPADSYGAPLHTFTATQVEYGLPERRDRENVNEASRGESRGRLQEREELEGSEKDAEVVSSQGAYYVLLPNAQVQRVQFQTQNDLRNMAYTARLQYRAEDRAPVYIYPAAPLAPTAALVQRAAYVQLV